MELLTGTLQILLASGECFLKDLVQSHNTTYPPKLHLFQEAGRAKKVQTSSGDAGINLLTALPLTSLHLDVKRKFDDAVIQFLCKDHSMHYSEMEQH